MNDRDTRPPLPYTGRVKRFLALLILFAAPASAQPNAIAAGPIQRCASLADDARCEAFLEEDSGLAGEETILVRPVTVDPAALPLSRPLMVWLTAMASAEIRWNGVVIGRNGVPGRDRAHERPGRFIATFVVPSRLVKPGENILSARLSAHHLWLPVRSQVHDFSVGRYESTALPGLMTYLPALLALGALAAAFIYFAAAAALDRRDKGALLLALVAGTAMLQLLAETARTFIAYTYPWHVPRVMAIALLAAAAATMIAAYSARRFAPSQQRVIVSLTAAAAVASALFIPWFDLKALGAILAGTAAILVCARRGMRDRRAGARIAAGVGLALLILLVWQRTRFLDQAYYLALAALLVTLVAEQVALLRQARHGRDTETLRARGLEQSLRDAARIGTDRVVLLKDGGRTHRVAERDILFVKAADDYCEVHLDAGRKLLVTTTLARLHASLPAGFFRVHKSYVVNQARVAALSPRPGGGRRLMLADGSAVPVGRSYGKEVAARIAAGE